MPWYTPVTELTEKQREHGLRNLFYDGLGSHAMLLLATGAFLPGMALALGAGNFVIGILVSMAPMSQMAQIPAIFLVEKIRLRKFVTVAFAFISRLSLLGILAIPWVVTEPYQLTFFVVLMVVFFVAGAIAGCAWGSWVKDVIPEQTMGSYFARRLSVATALGAVLTVMASFGIDGLIAWMDQPARAYSIVYAVAALFGLAGAWLMVSVPEPRMVRAESGANWFKSLMQPVQDKNFRQLLYFSGTWSFTVIMAGSFFAVYMLQRIGLPISWVILLAVLSQVTNIYFFRLWGSIADRFNNKTVLRIVLPLFILMILLYPFTTLPERYFLTLPLLILIHVIGGISTAGFVLCSQNIALRLAPKGKATAYLGSNAFFSGAAAAVAPIVGGAIGAFFATRELSIRIFYDPDIALGADPISMPALSFRGLDFMFFTAALVGLYALHRLSLIEEAGEINEVEVREQILSNMRQSLVSMSSFSLGLRRMTMFPYDMLKKTGKSTTSTLYRAAKKTAQSTVDKARSARPRSDS